MIRFAPAAATALAALLIAPASGMCQTVNDYQAALEAAKVTGVPEAAAEQTCRPLSNYVALSIPPWEAKGAWFASQWPWDSSPGADVAQARERCRAVLDHPVIAFNPNSAEEIVTPPTLDDPDALFRPVPDTGVPAPELRNRGARTRTPLTTY